MMGRGNRDDDRDVEMAGDSSASVAVDYPKDSEAMEFLTMARRLIDQGKPSQALQAHLTAMWLAISACCQVKLLVDATVVVMATKARGGDEAVFHFLNRAREQYRSRLLANSAVDQLASLFAECAIAEAQPLRVEPSTCSTSGQSMELDSHGPSILQESGRMQIVLDAFADGSSFICLQCGGLVSVQRKDEHYSYWCG